MTVTHHPDPASVDDGEGSMADQVLGAVLVDPDALHADGSVQRTHETQTVYFISTQNVLSLNSSRFECVN